MTRSRGQFDTRQGEDDEFGDGDRPDEPTGALERFLDELSFHRVEFLAVCWIAVGGIAIPAVVGLGSVFVGAESGAAEVLQFFFWTATLVAVPLLTLSLYAHALVDLYRVVLAAAEPASLGRIALRSLQTASSLVFALGIEVMLNRTATENVEFDPAALLSAFLLILGLAGMVTFVALDGVVRLVRGTW